jgi:histidinol-phosphate/aromatic aminotransferase/cobyric acid decarboxylase-like protein
MRSWGIPGAFRVTIGKKEENRQFLKVLTNFVKERGKHKE